tara:strand:- start:10245 stop:11177 length:933 start_codon:yes stop_codon:yes gene_type:complete
MLRLALAMLVFAPSAVYADDHYGADHYGQYVLSPQKPERERRDQGVDPFLKVSVGAEIPHSCSGTLIYYSDDGYAYVIGCGHCHGSVGSKVRIITYFVGDTRETRKFDGVVVAISQKEDLCIMKFKPDFEPNWVPIGQKDSPFFKPSGAPKGQRIVVTGRDAGLPSGNRDPAAYEAFIRETNDDWYLRSRQSQSRGGRSGGGVMTEDCRWLIGVNHGRGSTVRGIGHGLWAPLHRIHRFLEANQLEWLLDVQSGARTIPIVDHEGGRSFDRLYIPLPIGTNAGGSPAPPGYKYPPISRTSQIPYFRRKVR